MKQVLILTYALLMCMGVFAQNCPAPESGADLTANNIRARIKLGGDLFTNGSSGLFTPNWQDGANMPVTLFSASLWMAGIDPGGNLRMSATTYDQPGFDFGAGPLEPLTGLPYPNGCSNWNRLFVVDKADILAFQAVAASLTTAQKIEQFPSIMGWPGQNNPFFEAVNGFALSTANASLAPYYDEDSNGVYNPENGDYPVVEQRGLNYFVPDQIIWGVMNDVDSPVNSISSNPLRMEVQLSAWAFNCSDQPVLNNTIFTSHKLIYRGVEQLDSCFLGIWTDFDIGCYGDDYIGCAPALNTCYAYNTDAVDGLVGGTCNGVPTFAAAPVQSVTFLNNNLEKFIGYPNPSVGSVPAAMTDPTTILEYYNYMNGHWRDGTPMTAGGNGYNPASSIPANFQFPDNPADTNGWSCCTAGLAGNDWRALAVTRMGFEPGTLYPGEVWEYTTAWAVHENPALPCGLGTTLEDVAAIKSAYLGAFEGCGSLTSATHEVTNASLKTFPNPTSDFCTIEYGNSTARELRIVAADGRVVTVFTELPSGAFNVPMGQLAPGSYVLSLLTEEGVVTGMVTKF